MTHLFRRHARSLTAFADWLEQEHAAAGRRWSQRLRSREPARAEAAIAEALVWDYLSSRADSARVNETSGEGGVDFEFASSGVRFLVEVTNISSDTATLHTNMPDREPFRGSYSLLTDRIRQKVRNKFDQANRHAGLPVLVIVTTLHGNASGSCFGRHAVEFALGSTPKITMDFNPHTGSAEGEMYQSTDLRDSVFLSPNPIYGSTGDPIAQARFEPISGFLLGGFGRSPESVRLYGGLNPSAATPFDPSLLPDVPLCSFKRWPVTTAIELAWTISLEAEQAARREAWERRMLATGHGRLVDASRHDLARQCEGE